MPTTIRPAFRSGRELVARLHEKVALAAVELRPPRRGGGAGSGVETWIDLHHAVRRLAAEDTLVFTTDNAVGKHEEENLRHLHANVGDDADTSRLVPFLTTKHSLEYCLRFPERAAALGHRAVVVLGGDTHDGLPRCLPHAADLRHRLRERHPGLALGGWANPYRDPAWQLDMLERDRADTDFILTQVVSHHNLAPIEAFLTEVERRKLATPILFGVFCYRSGNPKTLAALSQLMPVPVAPLARELGADGVSPAEVAARTIRALTALGQRRVYLCNLPAARAAASFAELRGFLA